MIPISVVGRSRIKDQVAMAVVDNLVVTKKSSKKVVLNLLWLGLVAKNIY